MKLELQVCNITLAASCYLSAHWHSLKSAGSAGSIDPAAHVPDPGAPFTEPGALFPDPGALAKYFPIRH